MDIRDVVQRLLHKWNRELKGLTKGCGSCQTFIRRIRNQRALRVGWEDVPPEILDRFSSQLREQLFLY